MNARILSMIVCLFLVGSFSFSLCMSYLGYKDDVREFLNQREIRMDKEAENDNGSYNFTVDDFDLNPTSDLDNEFKTKLIIHLGAMGFILLSEIGLLIVLPKNKDKSVSR